MQEKLHINGVENTCLGIDIGSTTAKLVLVENGNVIYEKYERHLSQARSKTIEMIYEIEHLLKGKKIYAAISGSAGLGLANDADVPFVQEVFATAQTVEKIAPDTSAVIELGGEDAKIIFFDGGLDERMNGSCAGGTGAFIDQMATLLNLTNEEMDELSLKHTRIYPIASRCGVFAKTDIQPLLNQGAKKEDVAASIYQAVVNQTVAGLAQGRKIQGKVMFLGGPLYYCKGLRERFAQTLDLGENNAVFPEYGRFSVAIGAALFANEQNVSFTYDELTEHLSRESKENKKTVVLPALFESEADYDAFCERHDKASVDTEDINTYNGGAYLGIDCGSTTTKLVLISNTKKILYSYYSSNKGNPIEVVLEELKKIRLLCKDHIEILGSAVTGYGEELIRHAFRVDYGIVETMAHFSAAKHFNENVDFILDIGGQDIKCFKVRNNSIDGIMLNEACSSGCGSFIETFAKAMGYSAEEFSKLALFAKGPVDLGTRCTVFMNSSVKQAQKDGASVGDISAGLSISVVKNAIYKVIRAANSDELGSNIVVQGGTFLNDAVLRSFETEIGKNVVRPCIAGLMGAYGAALYAMAQNLLSSSLLTEEALNNFTHTSKSAVCKGCTNNCRLTINTFSDNEKFVSGNQCEKGAGIKNSDIVEIPNIYTFKREQFSDLKSGENKRGRIGLPMALGMYELYPLWQGIFSHLGFETVSSGFSTRAIYSKGQYSIPSDTACYPAKIMHGHIEKLIEMGVDAIFYPCLTYNFDEKISANHYNCPVVAYYSELLTKNMESIKDTVFLYPYLNINNEKRLAKDLREYLAKKGFDGISSTEMKKAVEFGMKQYADYMQSVRNYGMKAIDFARRNNKRIMILAGRPYHIDPEINHGIDKLATSLDFVVISEDSVSGITVPEKINVLNQWTYHARLYSAAQYAAENKDVELVQLVSFGCGVDAVTTDEVRSILENNNKLYTQIKIDEITNLGAVKIRLRSLIGALDERSNTNAGR